MIITDTSGLLALFNRGEPAHQAVREVLEGDAETLVVSPYVVAELDYLISTRVGSQAERDALGELASGAYVLAQIGVEELAAAVEVIDRYQDQNIGVADASIVVLAAKYETRKILTLDRRHFEVLRPRQGGRFRIVP